MGQDRSHPKSISNLPYFRNGSDMTHSFHGTEWICLQKILRQNGSTSHESNCHTVESPNELAIVNVMFFSLYFALVKRNGCVGSNNHGSKEDLCGRPLGLRLNEKSGDLFIADAYMGLLVVGSTGGLATQLVKEAQGIPLGFTNSLDIDPISGAVYFTDSSTRYPRRNYVSLILSGDNSGRLLKYDPKTKEVKVLLNNLMFPNGVALSKNGDFLLIAETTTCKILKFWLKPSSNINVGAVEVIGELPGFPDNIKRNKKGEFWVAINSRRGKFLKWILSYAWIRNGLNRLPFDITRAYSYLADFLGCGLAIKLNENGESLEILEDKRGDKWKYVSEVDEENGNLWIGSVKMPFVVKLKMDNKKEQN